jgi:hypothetical protein
MIRKVRIESGKQNILISLDENLIANNTWTRIQGDPSVFPESGRWQFGKNYNSHYLYLIGEKDNTILYFCDLGKKVGDRGLAQFLSSDFAIARNVILGWEIVSVNAEFIDKF